LFIVSICFGRVFNEKSSIVDWKEARENVKTVHVVYGCHLDLGFTDTLQNVLDLYFNQHFPNVYQTYANLKGNNSIAQFKWYAIIINL